VAVDAHRRRTPDVHWTPGRGDPVNADFSPFVELDWYPVQESHAQLFAGFFGHDDDADGIAAGVSSYLCDCACAWNADCRDFSAPFITSDDPALANRVAWAFSLVPDEEYCGYDYWFDVGKGAFSLTCAGATGS
jgi:hypothetical protein